MENVKSNSNLILAQLRVIVKDLVNGHIDSKLTGFLLDTTPDGIITAMVAPCRDLMLFRLLRDCFHINRIKHFIVELLHLGFRFNVFSRGPDTGRFGRCCC